MVILCGKTSTRKRSLTGDSVADVAENAAGLPADSFEKKIRLERIVVERRESLRD